MEPSDDPPSNQQQPRRKRRRKRKSSASRIGNNDAAANLSDDNDVSWRHQSTITATKTSSSSNCDALDAELENQVNKLILQSSNHDKNKKRVVAADTTTTRNEKEVVKSPNDMSSCLPILLHIRELGLSSRLGRRYRTQKIPFVANVDSLDTNGNNASWMTLLLQQPAYSKREGGRVDKQQSSSGLLSLDDTAVTTNDNNIGARWLRVPVQNRHVLQQQHDHADAEENYNKDAISNNNEATTTTIYRRKIWRPYTQQTIQFSKLNTPHSVAILAMDQWGGYMIGVAGRSDGRRSDSSSLLRRPLLSLQYYGIPSPMKLLSSAGAQSFTISSSSSMMISPLFHSIPLLLNNPYDNTGTEEGGPIIQISDTPIQILHCSNGAFGIGYTLDSRVAAPLRSDIFSRSPALQVRECCLIVE